MKNSSATLFIKTIILAINLLVVQNIYALTPEQVWTEVGKILKISPAKEIFLKLEKFSKSLEPESAYYTKGVLCKSAFEADEIDISEKCAKEYLSEANNFSDDWNFGNAIHDSNILLGRICLKRNYIQGANTFLLKASVTPGSPQLSSNGPDFTLARELFDLGQVDPVSKFLESSKKYWKNKNIDLLEKYLNLNTPSDSFDLKFFNFDKSQAVSLANELLEVFWDKAYLKSGEHPKPKDDKERNTIPLPDQDIVRIVNFGVGTGLFYHCDMKWEDRFDNFMKDERKKNWNETQIAFIGTLHGIAQGRTETASKLLNCTSIVIKNIENKK